MGAPPERWLDCPRKSESIIAERFVAFKTFLDEKFDNHVPEGKRFNFAMLYSYIQRKKKELGLILSLTNTNRFYDESVVEKNKVKFCKLACRGHGESPNVEQTEMFIKLCNNFFEKHPGKILGVHCTHGFNRTGFLIVAYLCEVQEWRLNIFYTKESPRLRIENINLMLSVEAAVSYFAKCRPPGIYKGDYLKELFARYGSPDEQPPPPPELPDWCFDESTGGYVDEPDEPQEQQGMMGKRAPKRRRRPYNENAKFCEDIPIETVSARGAERVQEIAEEMLQWDRATFPGSQPVSMDRENLQFLNKKPYKVSWKADGTRYLLLILKEGEVYFLDRDNSVFIADNIKFPRRKNPDEHVYDTLVDGELVMDKEGDQLHPRFLIYDIIKFEGQDVGMTDLDRRHLCIDKEIIKPRAQAIQAGKLDRSQEPFSIRKKDFFPCEKSQWVLDKFIPKIPHETDGLIFQPLLDHYTPGTCPYVLKWKPHELNSVDFLLNITTVKHVGCLPEKIGGLYVQGYDQPFSQIKITAELRHYDKRIIECTWENNKWKFLRIREDKSFPNAFNTAKSVCESIRNPVTKEMMLDYINKYGYRSSAQPQQTSQQS